MRNRLFAFILTICLVLLSLPTSAQEPDPVATWQTLVNEARLDEGLAPYGFSTLLNAAAQRHADDLAAHHISSHTGSDDSTPQQRIAEAGYAAWNDGESVVGENFWTGSGTIEDAMAFLLNDPPQRDNILNPIYREIGIGVATDDAGSNYYVLDFGARPNVLPIFINDGATNTDNPQIAIRLTNEEARPGGKGTIFMGQAIEMRISNEPGFNDLPWQPWEPLVPWTLPDAPGEHAVYVQFRDAAGRTAASTDAIVIGEGTPTTPVLSEVEGPTPVPPISTAEPAATPLPLVPCPSPLSPLPLSPTPLAPHLTPFPTWTPLPTATLPQEDSSDSSSNPSAPLTMLVSLQGLALILGIYLVLRRGQVGAG